MATKQVARALRDFDIIVVGGGMVGATLTLALAGSGMRIALIEGRKPDGEFSPGAFDLRVSAVTRASQRIFESLGAWPTMATERACPFRHIQVWDAGGSGRTRFDAQAVGEPCLGHIIENRLIQYALWQGFACHDNIVTFCPAHLMAAELGRGRVTAHMKDGQSLHARLLVGADGASSPVRRIAGIATVGWSYGQKTIVGTVRTGHPHRHTAWQRFLPTGPVAFLPLSDGRSSLAWHTTSAEADRLMALPESAFLRELLTASGGELGAMEAMERRGCFPLRMQHAVNYYRGRIVLIGDAAHTIHPLAGQGVNLGFLDAAALAQVLVEAAGDGGDVASDGALARYERWRKIHNGAIMLLMDAFKRVFGSTLSPVRWTRNIGLDLADQAGPIKRALMRQAMGLSGPLPELARDRSAIVPHGSTPESHARI